MSFLFKFFVTSYCSLVFHIPFADLTNSNSTNKHMSDEDYYVNYDYDLGSNNSELFRGKSESLIFLNPEALETKYAVDVLPKIELPDDSLADTDLRDHDFIDNLMYVYYGSHSKTENNYGPEIIIIGSVLSCAAQLLTIFVVLLKRNPNGARDVNLMFLHLMGCLCLSNLLFMLGVYATKSLIKCQIIAVTLHYLHLLIAYWLFFYAYYIYKRFHNLDVPKLHYMFSYAYSLPALLILVSFVVAPRSYETKRFCFVSVQKGMIVNYMLPVFLLIVLTMVFALNGLRKINLELSKLEFTSSAESLNALKNEADQVEAQKKIDCKGDTEIISLKECKYCLKALCVVQTSYDMVWFVAVLALENIHYSNSMSIVYSITSCLLNWYIFAKRKSFLPTLLNKVNYIDDNIYMLDQSVKVSSPKNAPLNQSESSDSIPLLINSETCTEMREMRSDYISTISS